MAMCLPTPADFDPRRVRFQLLAAATALVLLSACNRGEEEPPIADAATQRTLAQGEVGSGRDLLSATARAGGISGR